MAKHLSIIECNDKGHEARQYFNKCERLLKQVTTPQVDYSKPEALLGCFESSTKLNRAKG